MKVLSSKTEIQQILQLAPEWAPILESLTASRTADGKPAAPVELFERLGAKAIFKKLQALSEGGKSLELLVRDHYYQPLLNKMLNANPTMRRFYSQRRVAPDEQRGKALSFANELANKLDGVLAKHLSQKSEDGFKVLLPAYIQRTVHNAVIDHIRQEWEWERSTLQDLNLDPEQDDPRQNAADDIAYAPENQAISNEKVAYLNQLRHQLEQLLKDPQVPKEPLAVVDCMFGLGLTSHSQAGVELTMRECCEVLGIGGETQARKIARCQVLLDKGLDLIRNMVRDRLPGVAEFWQAEVNVNNASRRELGHYLGLTEGEVDRLIASRQYYNLPQLVERAVLKEPRLEEVRKKGAVAAFVPIDINSATNRDIIDILGASKDMAQKICAERPFAQLSDLIAKKIVDQKQWKALLARGAVLKSRPTDNRLDLNRTAEEQMISVGLVKPIAERLVRGRPFTTWAELEEYLGCDAGTWAVLRQNFCLGITPD